MPKAQKLSQSASHVKTKQITDFFPRKPAVSEVSTSSSARSKVTKVSSTQNTRTHVCLPPSKTQSENAFSISSGTSASQRTRPLSPPPSKPITAASPMHPSTKRLRSQSIVTSQPTKQPKRTKNILCESVYREDKMDVDENSVVYVPPINIPSAPPNPATPPQIPPSTSTDALSPGPQSDVSLVPSSVSDEEELGTKSLERKDAVAVRETVDHWRQEALPPSPRTSVNSPIVAKMEPQSGSQSSTESDRDMNINSSSNITPSRPNAAAALNLSIPTPPATDGPEDQVSLSPVKLLNADEKTEQLIREIKARAQARSAAEESSPLSESFNFEISDISDDSDDDMDLAETIPPPKHASPVKSQAKSPRERRYNLRRGAEKMGTKPFPSLGSKRDISPSPSTRRKPSSNPFASLLKEKYLFDKKTDTSSEERDKRLRDLANINLDDDSDEGDFFSSQGPTPGVNDGNPFLDDDQKQQVKSIFEGDKVIDDEEEQLRQVGKIGVQLWMNAGQDAMEALDSSLPSLRYNGSDPTLKTFAETVAHGDVGLVRLLMQSGVLESANYTDGQDVVNYLIDLAFSHREDDINHLALQILPRVLRNDTIPSPISLFNRILAMLYALGASSLVLERLGWTVQPEPQHSISDGERPRMVERLVLGITDVAKSGRLLRREIPDMVIVLLLIGIEPSTPVELMLQISYTIHVICQSLGPQENLDHDECAISNKILSMVQLYSVQNKLHTLSFISSSAGRTLRIARSIAHALVTDRSALLPSQYSALPPLIELLPFLNPVTSHGLRPTGKLEINENTDYVEMACWTCIIATAVTGIVGYLEKDRTARAQTSSLLQSPSKDKGKESIFTILRDQLGREIHDRILDTRAAHLDRSYTKAILMNTSHRIHYQFEAISRNQKKHSTNIPQYFSRRDQE